MSDCKLVRVLALQQVSGVALHAIVRHAIIGAVARYLHLGSNPARRLFGVPGWWPLWRRAFRANAQTILAQVCRGFGLQRIVSISGAAETLWCHIWGFTAVYRRALALPWAVTWSLPFI
jgi:hypothetical protein